MSFHFIADKLFQQLQKILTQLDPALLTPLEGHLDKTLCIHLNGFQPLYFIVEKKGLTLSPSPLPHPDTTFEGTLTAFFEMIFSKKPHTKGLHIRGDMELAKALYDTWQHFDYDFENQLAKVVGDTLAHSLCKSWRQSQDFARKTYENRKQDVSLYLQNETKLLITPGETEEFYGEVSRLRDDVERFAVKLNILHERLEKR